MVSWEVRLTWFDKLLSLLICVLFAATAGLLLLIAFAPQSVERFFAPGPPLGLVARVGAVPLGLFIFALGFASCWHTFHYRLWADDEGLYQKDGFRQTHVEWENIASHALNARSGEPVLLDKTGGVVFRPMAPVLTVDSRRRRLFWRHVVARIEAKPDSVEGN